MGLKQLAKVLHSVSKISLDSSVFIYYIEENTQYLSAVSLIFEDFIAKGLITATGSSLLFTEILTKPYKFDEIALAQNYKTILLESPNIQIVPVNDEIAEQAAFIRIRYNLKTPDAIHLASSIKTEAQVFICNDPRLRRVREVKILVLKDFT